MTLFDRRCSTYCIFQVFTTLKIGGQSLARLNYQTDLMNDDLIIVGEKLTPLLIYINYHMNLSLEF